MRCDFGMDWRTPGYIVREEVQREKRKLRGKTVKRAWKMKQRFEMGGENEIARRC